jgi:isocitrate dehydrogenase kinase/phosphatase
MSNNDGQISAAGAQAVFDAYTRFRSEFHRITARAQGHFEARDWHAMQDDARARLELRPQCLRGLVQQLHALLDDRVDDARLWAAMKQVYRALIADRPDVEIAETFWNSTTRRVLSTIGVNAQIEFLSGDLPDLREAEPPVHRSYRPNGDLAATIARMLGDYRFAAPYSNLKAACAAIAARISADRAMPDALEMLPAIFYRNKGAYIVGRVRRGAEVSPLLLPLLHTADGIVIDAVLLTADQASIVFSFARSYFHVLAEQPRAVVALLHSIMPHKPIAELYTSIGENKHGKTVLYRDLMRHIQHSDDQFEIARGERGMVMIVFTLPSYDVVFKIIKDRFAYPKSSNRQHVIDRYQLVFKHDRGGRLVDAQEFEYVRFDRSRFAPDLLEELRSVAGNTVIIDGDAVVITHLYTERRLTPLNLYLQESDPDAARNAVIDYGQCVKDLAATNIFPGDMLLKNFGVTRHGRVVFYDYDELTLLESCVFRAMPHARDDDEEFAAEPWYFVGEHDVFPEEFRTFLGLPPDLRRVFNEHHGDLFDVAFWTAMQQRHRAGEVLDVFPYGDDARLTTAGEVGSPVPDGEARYGQ